MDDVLALDGVEAERTETLSSGLRRPARWLVEALPGIATLNRLFTACERRPERRFADRALAALGVGVDASGVDRIPATGPAIVVANHPTGALDGLALLSLVATRRPDVRLIGNDWLTHITPLRADLIPVETFGDGRRSNGRPVREALRWLGSGGALIVFPAGAVSHLQLAAGVVSDPTWSDGVARLARLAGATVVPCHIAGRNSALFQVAGLLSPWLRTALLARELVRRRGSRIAVRVARPIDSRLLADRPDGEITRRLRELVYAEADAADTAGRVATAPAIETGQPLANEVCALPADRTLCDTQEYAVFWFRAPEAPRLLEAIGRAREATFRAAGEGTGTEIDLDRFDSSYLHLCLWDRQGESLAGAYRMRVVDDALRAESLYTNTLFDFDERLVRTLAPGLELGRAFVVPSHQKKHQPLLLLWSGIARFVALHPEIRNLFGAVSVGASYSPAARAFLAAYLRRHALDRLRAPLVAPRHPLEAREPDDTPSAPVDPQQLSASVQSRDVDGKGLPVLLRQYLKLHARVLDFSVDPAFSDVLDVLVTVDLPSAPRALLRRYMGEQAADAYLRHHARRVDAGVAGTRTA